MSFAFTSYQSNLVYTVGRSPTGGLQMHQSRVGKPMGLRYRRDGKLLLGAGAQIVQFGNALAPGELVNGIYSACFVPRTLHLTGHLDAHDVGLGPDGTPIFVNTRFNCIATVDPRHSFRALWQPPFISDLVDEDRCHLNGLALDEVGAPAFATAVSRSDTIDGWRDRRADGGVVLDIARDAVICEGLSMPHSPRLHRGTLYVLNAGTGEFGRVVRETGDGMGQFEPITFCPGFLRGLAFHGDFAFVGLSKPRYNRFSGLALDARLQATDSAPWCGVQVIDLRTGTCVDWLRLDGPVAELFDVEVLPGIRAAMAISPSAPDLTQFITFDRDAEEQAAAPRK